ncbi:MAG: hypothetical protein GIKADHBN_01030 [Phycisphaerales bacterium]|nr:hypothetical protein [Phycisphaerales bacterium]
MAKGQHLSRYQQGIVKRYYEHADTRVVTSLQELVSDLAVAETDAAKTRLWKRAADMLGKTAADPKRTAAIVAARDVKGLAQLVGELASSARAVKPDRPAAPRPPRANDDL